MHLFLRMGVEESDLRCMEVEAGEWCRVYGGAIETVAENRSIESIGMRSVHTELVRTAGEGIEINKKRTILPLLANGVTRDRRFTVNKIHHLTWSVVGVGQEGKGD